MFKLKLPGYFTFSGIKDYKSKDKGIWNIYVTRVSKTLFSCLSRFDVAWEKENVPWHYWMPRGNKMGPFHSLWEVLHAIGSLYISLQFLHPQITIH